MKDKLIEKILHYNDEAPREILYSMKLKELREYLKSLRETYPQDINNEPN